ncbi:MAG TPA: SH3 domain-containing protein, partial [Thermomicrobiales bacterium]|nr:SH3 domain-containing protein [Thermomicrobiales bacterium]
TTTAAPSKFAVGDAIVATEAVNIRSGAGTSNPVVTFTNAGGTATVLGGPQMASGLRWWNIRTSGGQTGWSIEDAWEKAGTTTTTTAAPPKFATGDAIRVTDAVNFRSAAGTSASVIAVLAAGTTGTITGGPTSANGYVWYQFRTSGGTTGWAVQDWLAKQ